MPPAPPFRRARGPIRASRSGDHMTGDIATGARPTGDMNPEEYRHAARRVADWTADYLRDVERFPVLAPRRRVGARRAAGVAATALRTARRDPLRHRPTDHPRDHPLAVAGLHGLLRLDRLGPGDPRGDPGRRVQRQRHALAHRAGGNRARAGHPRLASPDDRAARATLRSDQRHCLVEHALCTRRGSRGAGRSSYPRARHGRPYGSATPALLRVGRGALVRRQGRNRARHRQRRAAPHPGGRTFSHGPDRPAPGDSRGCRGRNPPIRGRGHGGNHLDDQRGPDPTRSPRCASSTGSGCMSTLRMAAQQR